ncbi:hypothetical protein TVAG_163160 [Trichomonas vaginalis G3]|uniref:DUF3447 domain-containing protein n=1 Tax=Trichomonas vaginalis (strain ATCC PRA-98 / G3) TaxID=412133 RepID=A2DFZ3_TRIV3|nr:spectrin binding [Trichomonas vaginalis G3]EAY20620.1 hypothetical protein TVAG_163160 [Trichomonas vaginalis G3]KAI5487335.1 spectrin binding [Trichomonas vaginalis G3]|eukprot:XP_001581606.1 hypothetical protein [Trichomonas vaginalis G3]
MDIKYNDLMESYKNYINISDAIYKLGTFNENERNKVYNESELNQIIDSIGIPPSQFFKMIENAMKYNNRYFSSYLLLLRKLSKVSDLKKEDILTNYEQEYDLLFDKSKNTILKVIMNDDLSSFIFWVEHDEFDEAQKINSNLLFPSQQLDLIQLCCYYGSVDCFKLLLTKYDTYISQDCLSFSFLGGNPDIMYQCLKVQYPDEYCMRNAIASHNIDFITFLMNEYKQRINLITCAEFNNLHAFFVYLDQNKQNKEDVDTCFVASSLFNIPSLCEYFLSHHANINATYYDNTAINWAAQYECNKTAEFLIRRGIDIKKTDVIGCTPLHWATIKKNIEMMKILIKNGADINAKSKFQKTPQEIAKENNLDLESIRRTTGVKHH